ncbi:MAG TPA: hypothetical protein VIN06_01310 [Devosia sp.]
MRTLPIAVAAILLAVTPVLAQFPPPGVYFCTTSQGAPFGTIDLFAAGDYQLLRDSGGAGTGQIASAGTSLRALSGPLADLHVKGVFTTDGAGETRFVLDSDVGPIDCGPVG